jgi:hypothetical protein
MTNLEKIRTEAELMRVKSARYDMAFKIAEMQESIARIQGQMQIQLDKEKELEAKLVATDPAVDPK